MVQRPTAPARCVNSRGRLLAPPEGLGGTYFARGKPERRHLPGARAQVLLGVGSLPTRRWGLQGCPFSVGRGIIRPDQRHDSSIHLRKNNKACRPWLYERYQPLLPTFLQRLLPSQPSFSKCNGLLLVLFSPFRLETPLHALRPTANVSIPRNPSFLAVNCTHLAR